MDKKGEKNLASVYHLMKSDATSITGIEVQQTGIEVQQTGIEVQQTGIEVQQTAITLDKSTGTILHDRGQHPS